MSRFVRGQPKPQIQMVVEPATLRELKLPSKERSMPRIARFWPYQPS